MTLSMSSFKVVVLGEILFDIFKEQNLEVLGGAPFNFAYHIQNFLGDVQFVSRIGQDDYGQKIRQALQQRLFPAQNIQTDLKYPTGQVQVTLSAGGIPDYNIVKPVAYDFIEEPAGETLTFDQEKQTMFYFGTLCQRNNRSKETIGKILDQSDSSLKFFDLNLREPHYDLETIRTSLERADVLKLNNEEAEAIAKMFSLGIALDEIVENAKEEFNIQTVCVTLGSKGSLLYEDKERIQRPVKKVDVLDTVGAGDAFSAVLAVGILRKANPELVMDAASEFAGLICQEQGAIPKEKELYRKIKGKYPELF